MTNPFEASPWQSVLRICDRLGSLRGRLSEQEENSAERARIWAEARKAVQQLRDCIDRESIVEHLLSVVEIPELSDEHVVILSLLTQQYLSGKERWIRGREIFQLLYPSSFERLRGLAILHPEASLRSSGALDIEVGDGGPPRDPLETKYRLSDEMVRKISGWPGELEPPLLPNAPTNAHQLFLRIKEILDLSVQRSQKLFERDDTRSLSTQELSEITELSDRIDMLSHHLREQLEESRELQTPISFLALQEECDLSWEEFLVIGCLFLSEIFHGEAYIPAITLVRLFCHSEEDLMHHQGLFGGESNLVRADLVQLEEMIDGRPMSSEVALNTWVVERLSAQLSGSVMIQQDEQIDFHLYLREIKNYDDFLRDIGSLDGTSEPEGGDGTEDEQE